MFEIKALIEEQNTLIALLLLNLAGTVAGFIFYFPQLKASPFWQWLMVPDCPIATLFFSIFLLLVLFKKRRGLIGALAFTSLIKYGFWTLLVFALHPTHYFGSNPIYFGVIALFHILMIAQAWIVIHFQRFSVQEVLFSLGFLFLNDISDYFFGTLPTIPEGNLPIITAVSFISTFLVCREALKFTKPQEPALQPLHRIRL